MQACPLERTWWTLSQLSGAATSQPSSCGRSPAGPTCSMDRWQPAPSRSCWASSPSPYFHFFFLSVWLFCPGGGSTASEAPSWYIARPYRIISVTGWPCCLPWRAAAPGVLLLQARGHQLEEGSQSGQEAARRQGRGRLHLEEAVLHSRVWSCCQEAQNIQFSHR